MNDETLLRRIARESIAKGMLPSHAPEQTWGGPGTGVRCALCIAPVDKDELEFEVEFDRERYHLHLACFSAWDAERKTWNTAARALMGEKPPGKSRPTAIHSVSPSNDEHDTLPERQGDGNIGAHEGERAYKSEAT
jgi:hypothetical protein